MIIRNLDENDDWTFGYGKSLYLKEQSACMLDLKTKLREWYNDCFFAQENGIPWRIRLGYKNQKLNLDNDIKTIILNQDYVLSLVNFNSEVLDRQYTLNAEIITTYTQQPQTFDFSQEIYA